ncbi:MAG: EF-P beta-lysylation protein EpmB [Gammaproteobacteria bacterium AqS3]|nr:EF-P beta-lysylation protein EpmB [Gammaproteobacteria bacterium AqS3]
MINNRPDWREQLRSAVRSGDELLVRSGIDAALSEQQRRAAEQFPVLVPPGLLARIRHGDVDDPILNQVLPLDAETAPQPAGFCPDPLREADFTPVPGLLHKYSSRALLILAGGCAVNCRYCFRRHFPYNEHLADVGAWVDYIASREEIVEVIFSGGDPLLWRTEQLAKLSDALLDIPHVRMLRIHSRIPVALPERIDAAFCDWCSRTAGRAPLTVVLHSNCAEEFDASVRSALADLRRSGVQLLNQSVLLHRINDSVEALVRLSLELHRSGVLPYYLFLLDAVEGAAHFAVDEGRAREIHAEVRRSLPGYLVPRLAREVAGEDAKQVLHG